MKQLMMWMSLCLLVAACTNHAEQTSESAMAFPADSVSADGRMSFHGLRIDEADAIAVSELKEHVLTGGNTDVKIAGEIDACCQAKGCWMTMKLDEGTDMRIKFKDYGFFVPKDAAGKTAIVEGKVFTDTTSVEELRHYAVDGGMSETEAKAQITQAEVSLAFEASGVIIKGE